MTFASLDSLQRRLKNRTRRKRAIESTRRRKTFRPAIDPLEKRNLLTTFTVINPVDGEAGSLRDVIEQANARPGADRIEFDLAVEDIQVSGQVLITDDLTIHGPGADRLSVSGDGDRVFAVVPSKFAEIPDLFRTPTPEELEDAPTVKIDNLTIQNGMALNALGTPLDSGFSFGGGIYNLGSSLHLDRVHMTGNTALGAVTAGGAVANEFGGVLTVSRSHFDANASTGGAIAVGGAITSDLGPTNDGTATGGTTTPPVVSIDRSSFVHNIAQAQLGYQGDAFRGIGGGGAILNVTGEMTITRSHFENNSAQGGLGVSVEEVIPDPVSGGAGMGGAILSGDFSPFGAADSSLTVSRSTFVGNVALGGNSVEPNVPGGIATGGAISVGNGTDAVLERNTFDSNQVIGGNGGAGSEVLPGGNGGIGTGGGVAAAGAATTLRLERNKFTENSAEGGRGGERGGGVAREGQDATGRGGGLGLDEIIYAGFAPGAATASSESDTFDGNIARGGIGGGIYNEGDLSLERTEVSENRAIGRPNVIIDFGPDDYTFLGAALGGGLSNLGSVDMVGVHFEANEARGADGAVGLNLLLDGAANYPGLATGGGFHNIGTATVSKSQFVANEAWGGNYNFGSFAGSTNGGGILNDGVLELSKSALRGNRSIGGIGNLGDINTGGGYGAGLTSGSVTALSELRSASLRVDRTSVEGNEARGGDGNAGLGIDLPPVHGPAGGIGGGILVYQGDAMITKSEITANLAVGGDGGLAAGGGVLFFAFAVTVNANLSHSTVANNTAIGGAGADGIGGGIVVGSLSSFFAANLPGVPNASVTIDRTDVVGNLAQGGTGGNGLGGGIFNGAFDADDIVDDTDAITVIRRSKVANNIANGGSGGDGIGGGVYNDEDGEFEKIRSEIFANLASTSDDDCFGC